MKERAEPSGREVGVPVDLRLCVAHRKPDNLTAYANVTKICEAYSKKKYRMTAIDLHKSPDPARSGDITAVLTPMRVPWTPKRRKIIRMLTDTKEVPEELNLKGNEEDFCNTG
jgi:hypothetical protein